jgi:hypothetical protein
MTGRWGGSTMTGDATAPLPVIAEATSEDILNACAQLGALMEETQKFYKLAAGGSADSAALVGLSNQVADKGWWLCTALEKYAENFGRAAMATSILDVIEQNPVPAIAAIPEPRRARHRKGGTRQARAPGERPLMFPVPAVVLVAFAALKKTAPHLGHAALHPAAWKLTGLKAAAAAVAVPAAGALVVGAVVISSPAGPHSPDGAGAGSSVPGWHTSAVPIVLPSSPAIALLATHPKAKHAARGKGLLYASGASLPPPYVSPAVQPSPSSAGPSASAAASAAGPAVLASLPSALDLSGGAPATLTLTATGSGWLSWRVETSGVDLTFSPDHGILTAGSSVTVTVSVDAAQASDGNAKQTFSIDGQTITVSLPAPVPVPSGSPDPGVTIAPTAAPTALPT